MFDWNAVITAGITGLITFLGVWMAFVSRLSSLETKVESQGEQLKSISQELDKGSETAVQIAKLIVQVEELRADISENNDVKERVAILEKTTKDDSRTQWLRIDECKKSLDEIKKEHYSHFVPGGREE